MKSFNVAIVLLYSMILYSLISSGFAENCILDMSGLRESSCSCGNTAVKFRMFPIGDHLNNSFPVTYINFTYMDPHGNIFDTDAYLIKKWNIPILHSNISSIVCKFVSSDKFYSSGVIVINRCGFAIVRIYPPSIQSIPAIVSLFDIEWRVVVLSPVGLLLCTRVDGSTMFRICTHQIEIISNSNEEYPFISGNSLFNMSNIKYALVMMLKNDMTRRIHESMYFTLSQLNPTHNVPLLMSAFRHRGSSTMTSVVPFSTMSSIVSGVEECTSIYGDDHVTDEEDLRCIEVTSVHENYRFFINSYSAFNESFPIFYARNIMFFCSDPFTLSGNDVTYICNDTNQNISFKLSMRIGKNIDFSNITVLSCDRCNIYKYNMEYLTFRMSYNEFHVEYYTTGISNSDCYMYFPNNQNPYTTIRNCDRKILEEYIREYVNETELIRNDDVIIYYDYFELETIRKKRSSEDFEDYVVGGTVCGCISPKGKLLRYGLYMNKAACMNATHSCVRVYPVNPPGCNRRSCKYTCALRGATSYIMPYPFLNTEDWPPGLTVYHGTSDVRREGRILCLHDEIYETSER